jgi:hypothetical protein
VNYLDKTLHGMQGMCVHRVDTLLLRNVVPILERAVGDTAMIAKARHLGQDVTA